MKYKEICILSCLICPLVHAPAVWLFCLQRYFFFSGKLYGLRSVSKLIFKTAQKGWFGTLVKMPLNMPTYHTKVTGSIPSSTTFSRLLLTCKCASWEVAGNGLRSWVPATHLGDPDGEIGSWLHLACAWQLQPFGRWIKDGRSLSLSRSSFLYNLAFQAVK